VIVNHGVQIVEISWKAADSPVTLWYRYVMDFEIIVVLVLDTNR
jgi:hypothetical protein